MNLFEKGIRSDKLLNTAIKNLTLFQDQNGNRHAITTTGLNKDIIDIPGNGLERWLRRLFLMTDRTTLHPIDIKRVADYVESLTFADDVEERPYFARVGQSGATLYYNIGGTAKKVVKITPAGVELLDNSNYWVCFRPSIAQTLPNLSSKAEHLPNLLHPFFRVQKDDEWVLLMVYIITCFVCDINHPILVLYGSAGSAKSTTMETIGTIVDPNRNNRLTKSPDRRNMIAALSNRYFIGFDNLQVLKQWLSDLLCSVSTGGSEPLRQYYTTNDLTEVCLKGCVCLNGIEVVAVAKDLLDRSILIELKRIPDDEILTEAQYTLSLKEAMPQILGSIFDVLHKALAFLGNSEIAVKSRMADFLTYGYAIAESIGAGLGEKFAQAYAANKKLAEQEERLPVIVECLVSFMSYQTTWSGTMTDLRNQLQPIAKQKGFSQLEFPASASALSRQIGYARAELERQNIAISQQVGGNRIVEIRNAACDDGLILG